MLSSWGYHRWNAKRLESKNYVVTCTNVVSGAASVCRKDSNAPARVIKKNDRCDCITRVHELLQCRHEICVHRGNFMHELFDVRWYYRDYVTQSYYLSNEDSSEISEGDQDHPSFQEADGDYKQEVEDEESDCEEGLSHIHGQEHTIN
ncbi:MAG: hypothetical protein ACREBR_02795, partial [bacterium]